MSKWKFLKLRYQNEYNPKAREPKVNFILKLNSFDYEPWIMIGSFWNWLIVKYV